MVWGIWGGCFWGIYLDKSDRTSVPMQRGIRFPIFRRVPMQCGARFVVFDVPASASCWAHRGSQKCYKTNAFLMILNMRGGQQMDAEKHFLQNTSGKIMFWAHTLGTNWVPLGWFVFGVQGSGAPMGFTKSVKSVGNRTVWEICGSPF